LVLVGQDLWDPYYLEDLLDLVGLGLLLDLLVLVGQGLYYLEDLCYLVVLKYLEDLEYLEDLVDQVLLDLCFLVDLLGLLGLEFLGVLLDLGDQVQLDLGYLGYQEDQLNHLDLYFQ
jgi:hypothetical protein